MRKSLLIPLICGLIAGGFSYFIPRSMPAKPDAAKTPGRGKQDQLKGGPGPSRPLVPGGASSDPFAAHWTMKEYSGAWARRYGELLATNPAEALALLRQRYGVDPPARLLTNFLKQTGLSGWPMLEKSGIRVSWLISALADSGVIPDETLLDAAAMARLSVEETLRLTACYGAGNPGRKKAVAMLARKLAQADVREFIKDAGGDLRALSAAEQQTLLAELKSPLARALVSNTLTGEGQDENSGIANYKALPGQNERRQYVSNFLARESKREENPLGIIRSAASIEDPAMRKSAVLESLSMASSRGPLAPLAAVLSEPDLMADPEITARTVEIAANWDGSFGGKQWRESIRKAMAASPGARALIESSTALVKALQQHP